MKSRVSCILMTLWLLAGFVTTATAREEELSRQVLAEINLARTEPHRFAGFLRGLVSRFQGKFYRMPGTTTLMQTNEGLAAVNEAIRFLSRRKPLPPLKWSEGLASAATELVREQGETGATGHIGVVSHGMRERIERHGTWLGRIAENIAYGPADARGIVMQLIIDDGVPDRGHRKNLFDRLRGADVVPDCLQ